MGHSLSKEAQAVLDAAATGDALLLENLSKQEPERITSSVTLLKRRSVLHLAAKQGHSNIIHTVLEPLLEAVRDEYYAHQSEQQKIREAEVQQPDEHGAPGSQQQEQQQQLQGRRQQQEQQQVQAQQQQQRQQQQEPQLASFKKLRHTVNARDLYRRTPLIVAAKQGHLDCTQLLVEAASNLFAVDREGNTSLHYAALHGHALVTDYLLQKASDRGLGTRLVNRRNLSGFTALHYAVWSCSEGVVQQLLAAGADVSVVNDRVFDAWVPVPVGSTPLHLAVMRHHIPIALQILHHYVLCLVTQPSDAPRPQDPRSVVNLYGMTPAQLALHRNHRQLARLLMPSLSLTRVLEALEPDAPRIYGPPSLKSIAGAVMQQQLTAQLQQLEAVSAEQQQVAAAAAAASLPCKAQQQCVAQASCNVCSHVNAARSNGSEVAAAGLPAATRQDSLSSAASSEAPVDLEILEEGEQSSPAACSCCCRSALAQDPSGACAGAGGGGDAGGDDDVAAGPAAAGTACNSGWYDELCCVCWEESVTITVEPCMHALCHSCARQLVAAATGGATCPLCRGWIASFGLVPPAVVGAAGVPQVSKASDAGDAAAGLHTTRNMTLVRGAGI